MKKKVKIFFGVFGVHGVPVTKLDPGDHVGEVSKDLEQKNIFRVKNHKGYPFRVFSAFSVKVGVRP